MFLIIGYCIYLLLFGIYSYALMDPNITFFNSPVWTAFRNQIIYFGYYQRELSSIVYILGIIGFFVFHFVFLKKKFPISPLQLAIVIGFALLFSYPFLSHDIFNYMFDAKIVTFYHQNPYLHKALDFPSDPWTRFMHWTHRTYPYGPTFILITIIPSFLSFGKFILSFILFKLLFTGFYIWGVWALQQKNKNLAILFATQPLIIVEGLMNAHNDLISVALVLLGAYYVLKKNDIWGRLLLLISIGIKYTTLPFLFITKSNKLNILNILLYMLLTAILLYMSFKMEIQPWYFLILFGLIPLIKDNINKLNIFIFGLLMSYYPYVRFGEWDAQWKVDMKHWIIWVFAGLNIVYLVFIFSRKKFLSK